MSDLVGPEDQRNLRLRDAFASRAEPARHGETCPPADDLWKSARGGLRKKRREAVIEHLAECSSCAAAWRLARELRSERERTGGLLESVLGIRRSWIPAVAAAAMVLVVGGVAIRFGMQRRELPSDYRAAEIDWIRPADGITPLPRERCVLRWTPGPKGTVFDIRVMTEDLAPVAHGRGIDRPEFTVPAPALERMPSGGRLVWQVTAHLPDGRRSDSRTFTSEVR